MSKIISAPIKYDGTLEEFYSCYAQNILISEEVIEDFHNNLVEYLHSPDALYLIRQVKNQTRGETLRINNGVKIRLTDNSPAWWLHYQLFSGRYGEFTSFEEMIHAIPSHMFEIKIKGHLNHAGWHAAHLFDVKDRNIDFQNYSKFELIKRTARSIHPCNYFYIAKHAGKWEEYGKDQNILSFFYEKFKNKYYSVWDDFLRLIDAEPLSPRSYAGKCTYAYTGSVKYEKTGQYAEPKSQHSIEQPQEKFTGCKVKYEFSRLCFKADLIEPLDWDDYFCVIVKDEVFKMTKREFYEIFSNVVKTKSYQEGRIYHYPVTPKVAEKFKKQLSRDENI